MRQVSFAMLVLLACIYLDGSLSMAQQVCIERNQHDIETGLVSNLFPTSDHSFLDMCMVMSQRKTENKSDKESNVKYQDKHHSYQCFDSCIESRTHCERYAITQKDKKIGVVGSKENNEWSRGCEMTYMGCIKKCKK